MNHVEIALKLSHFVHASQKGLHEWHPRSTHGIVKSLELALGREHATLLSLYLSNAWSHKKSIRQTVLKFFEHRSELKCS
jgi:hypothetical protein